MKCSIITIHHIHNFGSVLQAYSLFKFLKTNGVDAEIIDYRPKYYHYGRSKLKTAAGIIMNYESFIQRKRKFSSFISCYDGLTKKVFRSKRELKDYYATEKRVFIVGGDQLWNNYHPCGNDSAYKLSFATRGKKIAYATSMGRNNYSNEELKQLSSETSDFFKIMLREQSTVETLRKYTNVPVEHVIDPVGLLDRDDFERLAKKPDLHEPYAVMYLADSGKLLDEAVQVLSKKMGLKIVHICGFRKKCYCDYLEKSVGPEEILGYILNAEFVLSASFHATLFSILFNRQFASLLPGTQTNERICDLLRFTGLEKRIIHSTDDLEQIDMKIDYTSVNCVISQFKQKSIRALLDAVSELSEEQL